MKYEVECFEFKLNGLNDEIYAELHFHDVDSGTEIIVKGMFDKNSELPKLGERFNFSVTRAHPQPRVGKFSMPVLTNISDDDGGQEVS